MKNYGTLTDYIEKLPETVETVVVINERGHNIYGSNDYIYDTDLNDVVEIISENATSVVIRVKDNTTFGNAINQFE